MNLAEQLGGNGVMDATSMNNLQLKQIPIARTGMLIRRPVADVFEAFINPDVTTRFWFTGSSGRLEAGRFNGTGECAASQSR